MSALRPGSRRFPHRAALVLACVGALGCGGTDDTLPPIRVGVLTPMSGDLAVYGRDVHAGTILAVDEINLGGGIDGRLLKLEARDDGTSAEGSRVSFSNLLSLGVAAVIGPGHSAGALAMADQIRTGRTLTISGSTTAAALATLDDGGYFFRTVPGDDKQAKVMARMILDKGVQHLCLVHRGDAYGDGLAAAIRAGLGNLDVKAARYDPVLTALDGVLDACKDLEAADARGILFVTFEGDGKDLMNDAARRKWRRPQVQVFLVDGNRAQRLYDQLDDKAAVEGALGTAPAGPALDTPDGARLAAFRSRFVERWGGPPGVHADANYDATYLAATALAIAGADAPGDQVRNAMALTRDGAVAEAGNWRAISEAIARDGRVDYAGASGAVNLDPASGELEPPYYISVWTISASTITDMRIEVVPP